MSENKMEKIDNDGVLTEEEVAVIAEKAIQESGLPEQTWMTKLTDVFKAERQKLSYKRGEVVMQALSTRKLPISLLSRSRK